VLDKEKDIETFIIETVENMKVEKEVITPSPEEQPEQPANDQSATAQEAEGEKKPDEVEVAADAGEGSKEESKEETKEIKEVPLTLV